MPNQSKMKANLLIISFFDWIMYMYKCEHRKNKCLKYKHIFAMETEYASCLIVTCLILT